IYDYLNNEYQAYIYEESISKEHDLAVLYIEKTDIELEVITFNFRKPQIGHKVIAIGQPNGQANAITFGEVMGYDAIEVYDRYDELYQHEFEAMVHTALTATGSSGGMLLDYNLLVIGIHFAGNSLPNDVFEYGYAIPTETVIEYLNLFVFKTNEPIA
ncbi:MAG: trypsin-like peptidase domain-containing protein, partial [Acholeplasmataceae bacterium]|nr:trypsin-like peptidase domain-containing protein [Acholeplasmataceae bacterium]